MINKEILTEIDKTIKEIWLKNIKKDFKENFLKKINLK